MITKVNNCSDCPYLIYDDTNGNDCHFPNSAVDHYELPDFGDKKTIPEKCLLKKTNMFITQDLNIKKTIISASAKYCDDLGFDGDEKLFNAFCAGAKFIINDVDG